MTSAPARHRASADARRDFALLWGAQTVSACGTAVSSIALPLVALTVLDATTFQVGLVTAAGYVAWLVFGLPSGAQVDRVRRRPLILATDAARGLALLSIPLAWAFGTLSLAHLIIVALLVGTASVYFDVAFQAYLPSVIAAADLLRANSRLQGSESVAQVGGPALGGILIQALGAPVALLADVGSYAVSVACVLGIRRDEQPPPRISAAGLPSQIMAGLRFVRRHPVIGPLTLSAAVLNFAGAALEALVVVFLVRTVGVSPGMAGVLLGGLGLGGIAGAASVGWLSARLGSVGALFLAATAGPLLVLLVPLTVDGPGLLFFAAGTAGISASTVVFSVLARSYRQSVTPPQLLGRVTATVRFVSWGVLPVGAVIAGALGEELGNREALWVVGAVFLLAPVPILLSPLRHTRTLTAESRPIGPARHRTPSPNGKPVPDLEEV